jgi:hypothetical protein
MTVGQRPPTKGRPRVVAAAVERSRRSGVVRKLNWVVENGGEALMITAEGRDRPGELDPRVQVLDLTADERRLGLNKIVTRDPARLVRRARGLEVSGPSPVWARLSVSKPYRMIRPWLLWRALRKRLDVVRVEDVDHVIIVHPNSWPIAWQLNRLNPAVSISYEVPPDVWGRAGRAVPPPPPEPPPVDPAAES